MMLWWYGAKDWRWHENVLEKNCWDYNQNIVVLKDCGWDLDPFRMCINELNDPLVPACTI